MPKAKRSPINYTPQFGAGIFRPKETVAEELAELDDDTTSNANTDSREAEADQSEPAVASTSRSSSRVRSVNVRTNEQSNERTVERNRVRHSFDIWQDQLLGLSEIQ